MFELIGIFAILGWLILSFLVYLSTLAIFPFLVAMALAAPPLAVLDYRRSVVRNGLAGMRRRRAPVPPERFYWWQTRARLGWEACGLLAVAAVGWTLGFLCPPALAIDAAQAWKWAVASLAAAATARLCSRLWLYVAASQWFDVMTPRFVGWLRRGIYRLSGNYEYLGEPRRARHESVV